jgi:hypothetical protein
VVAQVNVGVVPVQDVMVYVTLLMVKDMPSETVPIKATVIARLEPVKAPANTAPVVQFERVRALPS